MKAACMEHINVQHLWVAIHYQATIDRRANAPRRAPHCNTQHPVFSVKRHAYRGYWVSCHSDRTIRARPTRLSPVPSNRTSTEESTGMSVFVAQRKLDRPMFSLIV